MPPAAPPKRETVWDSGQPGQVQDLPARADGPEGAAESVPAGMLIVAVRRGGPADVAGIEPGDSIEKVGDVPLTGRDRYVLRFAADAHQLRNVT